MDWLHWTLAAVNVVAIAAGALLAVGLKRCDTAYERERQRADAAERRAQAADSTLDALRADAEATSRIPVAKVSGPAPSYTRSRARHPAGRQANATSATDELIARLAPPAPVFYDGPPSSTWDGGSSSGSSSSGSDSGGSSSGGCD